MEAHRKPLEVSTTKKTEQSIWINEVEHKKLPKVITSGNDLRPEVELFSFPGISKSHNIDLPALNHMIVTRNAE